MRKQSTCGCRSRGWLGEGRSSGCRWGRGSLWPPRFSHPFPDGFWWRDGLKLANYRVGIDGCRCRRRKVTGLARHLHRNCQGLVLGQRVGHAETVCDGHCNGTGRFATRSLGCAGVRTWRRRIQLYGDRRRRRPEGVHRKRRTAGQAKASYGNHDDSTHDPSVTLLRQTATVPAVSIEV